MFEVLRVHSNEAAPWGVDLGYENERDRHEQRQNEKFPGLLFDGAPRTIAEQKIAADGDRQHQPPGRPRDAVPPGRLRVRLRVQHIVHARNHKGDHRRRLCRGSSLNDGPQVRLQLSGRGIDLLKMRLISCGVERNPLVQIAPQELTHFRGIIGT